MGASVNLQGEMTVSYTASAYPNLKSFPGFSGAIPPTEGMAWPTVPLDLCVITDTPGQLGSFHWSVLWLEGQGKVMVSIRPSCRWPTEATESPLKVGR